MKEFRKICSRWAAPRGRRCIAFVSLRGRMPELFGNRVAQPSPSACSASVMRWTCFVLAVGASCLKLPCTYNPSSTWVSHGFPERFVSPPVTYWLHNLLAADFGQPIFIYLCYPFIHATNSVGCVCDAWVHVGAGCLHAKRISSAAFSATHRAAPQSDTSDSLGGASASWKQLQVGSSRHGARGVTDRLQLGQAKKTITDWMESVPGGEDARARLSCSLQD